jgi:hypothetical protein
MARWRKMDSAPKTGERILILTSDFGILEGWWDAAAANFYKSQEGWASHDPENAQGDWVSEWALPGSEDRRLYCGATPQFWKPIGKLPKATESWSHP